VRDVSTGLQYMKRAVDLGSRLAASQLAQFYRGTFNIVPDIAPDDDLYYRYATRAAELGSPHRCSQCF